MVSGVSDAPADPVDCAVHVAKNATQEIEEQKGLPKQPAKARSGRARQSVDAGAAEGDRLPSGDCPVDGSKGVIMQGYLFEIRIVVDKDGDGFCAACPDLGCVQVYGDTEEEALANAKDAAQTYLAMTVRHGDPIPVGIVRWQGSPISLAVEMIKRRFRRRREHVADVHMPVPETA